MGIFSSSSNHPNLQFIFHERNSFRPIRVRANLAHVNMIYHAIMSLSAPRSQHTMHASAKTTTSCLRKPPALTRSNRSSNVCSNFEGVKPAKITKNKQIHTTPKTIATLTGDFDNHSRKQKKTTMLNNKSSSRGRTAVYSDPLPRITRGWGWLGPRLQS